MIPFDLYVIPRSVLSSQGFTFIASFPFLASQVSFSSHPHPLFPVIDEDLNQRLNLNGANSSFQENRKQVLESLIFDVKKRCGNGDISLYCKRRLEKIQAMDDQKIPYVGILIWWLEKHIK